MIRKAFEKVGKKQALLAAITRYFPDATLYIADGAIRTGKTVFLADGFCDWIRRERRDQEEYFAVAQTKKNLKKNVMRHVEAYFAAFGYSLDYNDTELRWEFSNGDGR